MDSVGKWWTTCENGWKMWEVDGKCGKMWKRSRKVKQKGGDQNEPGPNGRHTKKSECNYSYMYVVHNVPQMFTLQCYEKRSVGFCASWKNSFWQKTWIFLSLSLARALSDHQRDIRCGLWLRGSTHGARTQARTGTWERKNFFAWKMCNFVGVNLFLIFFFKLYY